MGDTDLLGPLAGLLGGLAVFLLGLDTLTESLRAQSGSGLRTLMGRLTRNRFTALLTGAGATVLLQSSSVTTVLTVGLVSAGIMTFPQSLGVVLGANVGTTFTAQVIAFDLATVGLVLLAAGYLLTVVSRRTRVRLAGSVGLGLGLVLLGMEVMGSSMRPLRELPWFVDALGSLATPVLGVLAGAGFTALVQSSTAATALAIALAGQGLIALDAGVAIIIGANVGTCVTAGLAAIGKPPEAVRVAVAHVLINLAGAAAWLVLLRVLVDWAQSISPEYPELAGIERRAAETPRQLAMAHTLFNVSTALVLVWFVGPLGRIVARVVPDRGLPADQVPRHLEPALLDAPGAALEAARAETAEIGQQVESMLRRAVPTVLAGPSAELDELVGAERDVDARYRLLLDYLSELTGRGVEAGVAGAVTELVQTVDELEIVADTVGMTLVALGRQRESRGVTVSPAARDALDELVDTVGDLLSAAVVGIAGGNEDPDRIDVLSQRAGHLLGDQSEQIRLQLTSGRIPVREYALVSDLLVQLRRVHESGLRIAHAGITRPV